MKIAILNLQYDNNYGGNLQRYALITVLRRMGHDAIHLNLRSNYDHLRWYEKIYRLAKRIRRYCFIDHSIDIFPLENKAQRSYDNKCKTTDIFYNKYIKHSKAIYHKKDLKKLRPFQVYIVGSDQVWRKEYCNFFGMGTFFLNFLSNSSEAKRIAYSVSMGTDEDMLNASDLKELAPLYERFNYVSVREHSALFLFEKYGWKKPKAEITLDPTLLLSADDYIQLIHDAKTHSLPGELFCYILDETEEKNNIISEYAKEKSLTPFVINFNHNENISIQQWLRYFLDAKFVITDSYHGLLFSIIFQKPFKIIRNQKRGNTRFDTIFNLLQITEDSPFDWGIITSNLSRLQTYSLQFIETSLKQA